VTWEAGRLARSAGQKATRFPAVAGFSRKITELCRFGVSCFVVSLEGATPPTQQQARRLLMTTTTFESGASSDNRSDYAHAESAAPATTAAAISKKALWSGRVMTGLVGLFLFVDGVFKFIQPEPVVTGTQTLGYDASVLVPLGSVLLSCVVLYLIPRTAVLGAVLLTGYLGGAIASHVRVGNPLASHVLFPVYLGVLVWGGLYLRDLRVRALIRPAPRDRAKAPANS
jgi:hypothetical protein